VVSGVTGVLREESWVCLQRSDAGPLLPGTRVQIAWVSLQRLRCTQANAEMLQNKDEHLHASVLPNVGEQG
jgi:hypothetical protein